MTRRKNRKSRPRKKARSNTDTSMTLGPMGTGRTRQMWSPVDRKPDAATTSWLEPQQTQRHPQFQDAEGFADWVFNVAKCGAVQLDLVACDCQDAVRDALLKRFHRWPESKLNRAMEQCREQCQLADQRCEEQVQLYIQELRGRLLSGVNALFWLNVLLPDTYPTPVETTESQDVLREFLLELKAVDGLFEQLAANGDKLLRLLKLPLTIEPLFQGVAALATYGHDASAREAMQILSMYAEEHTGKLERGQLPLGLPVVASVGNLLPVDVAELGDLPEPLRVDIAMSLALMMRDWLVVVEEALGMQAKSLSTQWCACERAPYEQVLQRTVQTELKSAFAQLQHALATNQLLAVRKLGGGCPTADSGCVRIRALAKDEICVTSEFPR